MQLLQQVILFLFVCLFFFSMFSFSFLFLLSIFQFNILGRADIVKILVEDGAKFDVCDDKFTAVRYAINGDHANVVKELVNLGRNNI